VDARQEQGRDAEVLEGGGDGGVVIVEGPADMRVVA
jgi:hypothetical protein